MGAIVTFKADNQIYLLIDKKDMCVAGYTNVETALKIFEDAYNRHHDRGYGSSMSACLNYMEFDIAVHDVGKHPDASFLLDLQVLEKPHRAMNVNGMAGYMSGILLTGPNAVTYHNSGARPRLISYDGEPRT